MLAEIRVRIVAGSCLLAFVFASCGCTALQELAALRSVTFSFDRVADVRLAGLRVEPGAGFGTLTVADVARLGAALANRRVPLEMTAHVRAENPAENRVAARMAHADWRLFVEDREVAGGNVGQAVSIAPGQNSDVPVVVRFDLLVLASGGVREIFDTALAISGYGSAAKDLRLELMPTIDTSLGPIRYPTPVILHRAAGR